MKNLTYLQIRRKYLDYLISKGHFEIPSAPLVPENDPSLLFVNSGMFPLVPYLLGEKHPNGTLLTDSQRCIRTVDIDGVGDAVHLTAFEMLGNWSLNDYFKDEAINITIDFLVDELGFEIKNICGTVFIGDDSAPKDTVSIEVWTSLFKKKGIDTQVGKGERIQEYGKDKNWWELEAGGPCGPCSEIFYDTGKEPCSPDCHINCDCGKYVELGNNVFMEYLKKDDNYYPLGRHNVDFGGGLDRWTMFSQNVESVWETDMYIPIMNVIKELASQEVIESERILADHMKAATWMVVDGVTPGRTAQGYILRRIIRRAVRHARKLGIQGTFTRKVASITITQFSPIYEKLSEKREEILKTMEEEEIKFNHTLDKGLREFEKIFEQLNGKVFTNENEEPFSLYETYGFPLEITLEELISRGIKYDLEAIKVKHDMAFKKHQDLSRKSTKGLFKGGLADTSEMSTKYHTANHLLLAALYEVLGTHIYQKGSNITPERLRLDFPNDTKMTSEQISKVEKIVNDQIEKALPISYVEMEKEDALKIVKYASFAEKYSELVKVYSIGDPNNSFSKEICGGPHVQNTKELGRFKIIKEESVAAGIRRIKAVLL